MIVLHGAISIAIILGVALLVSQETPPALMEPAAPPTAMSISPHGFLSLSIWMFFESLQPLPCFLLATFWNASSCPHCSNSKKSLQLSLLPLHMMASKHGEVASLEGRYFLQKQGSKVFRLISVLFVQSYIYFIQQSAIGFDQPPHRFVEIMAA